MKIRLLAFFGSFVFLSVLARPIDDPSKDYLVIENPGQVIPGGTLVYGVVSDSPNKGLLDFSLYEDGSDAAFIGLFAESLIGSDENRKLDNSGASDIEFDKDAKTILIKIKDNVKWHDGVPVTVDDYIYALEVIADPDYTGVRYDSEFRNIVGVEEYHDGKSKSIFGLEKIDDRTIKVHFKKFNPSVKIAGGLWSYAMPKHYLSDVPVKDLAQSDKVRLKPIGFGPFIVENVVPGESIKYRKNPDYWKGAPKLDGVIAKIVSTATVIAGMRNGEFDLVSGLPTSNYDIYKDLKNFQFTIQPAFSYGYIGFKLGHWDVDKKRVIYDPKSKMANKSLRQAMGYALDNDLIAKSFYHGVPTRANSAIVPAFKDVWDPDLKGYTYDPEKAKNLLDLAGYKDLDGDGYREDPDGNKLVIKYAQSSGGPVAEPIAQYRIQAWKAVGLKVELTDGRLLEFNNFYDRLDRDDPQIDVYSGGWGTGSDPSPTGLYGPLSRFNYTRWEDSRNTELLEEIDSEKSLDDEYRKKAFKEWQEYFSEEAPIIPTLFSRAITPVNNRIKYYNASRGEDGTGWEQIEFVSDKPIRE